MTALFTLVFLLLLTFVSCDLSSLSEYQEHLLLRPLAQSSLLASFSFQSNTSEAAFQSQNFRHFPRALGQILQHAHTKELHLRFTSGRWDASAWGPRPRDGFKEGGTGVELWAWVEAPSMEEADAQWLTLTNALSGLFCASLNFVDSTRTIRPVVTFQPQGDFASSSSLHLLHGTLPGEVVCTENLTPFLKLLPCKGTAGVSSLLNGHKLFDSSWQTMAIDVQQICEQDNCIVQMEQNADMVLNIERSRRPQDDPIPIPAPVEEISCDPSKYYTVYGDSCYPQKGPSSPKFNLSDIFGKPIQGACPLSSLPNNFAGSVSVDAPLDMAVGVNTSGKYNEVFEKNIRSYIIPDNAKFDIQFGEKQVLEAQRADQSGLTVERTLSGYGQQLGGIKTILTNPTAESMEVAYLEPIPWFMKPFLHTLQTETVGNQSFEAKERHTVIKKLFYRPSIDRRRGTHLELVLTLPAGSQVILKYDFEKSILRYTEYPPDANRGFNVAPAIIRVKNDRLRPTLYLRTTSLLLYLPTPDFSMPYNVIILSSTVIALAFGSVFNLVVRRFVIKNEAPPDGLVKESLRNGIATLKSKYFKQKTKRE